MSGDRRIKGKVHGYVREQGALFLYAENGKKYRVSDVDIPSNDIRGYDADLVVDSVVENLNPNFFSFCRARSGTISRGEKRHNI